MWRCPVCKHCDTILDILRDARIHVDWEDVSVPDEESRYGVLHIEVGSGRGSEAGLERAEMVVDAIDAICGKRKLIEVEERPVTPRPSQRRAKRR